MSNAVDLPIPEYVEGIQTSSDTIQNLSSSASLRWPCTAASIASNETIYKELALLLTDRGADIGRLVTPLLRSSTLAGGLLGVGHSAAISIALASSLFAAATAPQLAEVGASFEQLTSVTFDLEAEPEPNSERLSWEEATALVVNDVVRLEERRSALAEREGGVYDLEHDV